MRVPKYTPPPPTDTTPTLLTGGSAQYGQPYKSAWLNRPRLNWNIWRHMFEVELWQACALSLNIDPKSMHPERRLSFGNGPYFGEENFPNSATKVVYEERLMLLTDHLSKSPFFSPNKLNMGKLPKLQEVKLGEFAAWGLSLGWELPPELVALAQSQKSATEATPLISVPYKSPRDFRPWETLPEHFNVIKGVYMYQQAAREIADAEGWDDSKLEALENEMSSAVNIGLLRTRSRKTGMVIEPDAPDSLWLVTVDDVNAWLEKQGVAYRWRVANSSPTTRTLTSQSAPAKAENVWDEPNLKRLLKEINEPDMTQEKLGERYGVTRQCIGAYLKKAKELFGPKKASWVDAAGQKKKK